MLALHRTPRANEEDDRSDNEVMRAEAGAQLVADFMEDVRTIRRGIFG